MFTLKDRARITTLAAFAGFATATSAGANELIGGVYAHNVDLPTSLGARESGTADVLLGWRGDKLTGLRAILSPAPHAYVLANTGGNTSFVSAGLSWKLRTGRVYVRPGLGVAVHNGKLTNRPARIGFGSRILFAPELSVGALISNRATIEASWLHFSHATLLAAENPGIDIVGVRVGYSLR
jgi:lipid A 3-O-deacylase